MSEPVEVRTPPPPDLSSKDLPARIKSFRTARGLTQRELARAIAATPAAVRRWEAGTARPTIEEVGRLSSLGMLDISDADTNAGSIARLNGKTAHERIEQARRHREAGARPLSLGEIL